MPSPDTRVASALLSHLSCFLLPKHHSSAHSLDKKPKPLAAPAPPPAANLLKPMLARGELRLIGATTLNEYREHVEKDAAFERRFQQVGGPFLTPARICLSFLLRASPLPQESGVSPCLLLGAHLAVPPHLLHLSSAAPLQRRAARLSSAGHASARHLPCWDASLALTPAAHAAHTADRTPFPPAPPPVPVRPITGAGRGAVGTGYRPDPSRPKGAVRRAPRRADRRPSAGGGR